MDLSSAVVPKLQYFINSTQASQTTPPIVTYRNSSKETIPVFPYAAPWPLNLSEASSTLTFHFLEFSQAADVLIPQ